jgi:CubicO group peptidase (beta-lactamase class C family)
MGDERMSNRRLIGWILILGAVSGRGVHAAGACADQGATGRVVGAEQAAGRVVSAAVDPGVAPQPAFADPERRATLLAAVPAIEALVQRRQQDWRLPGVFYGLIVDGELVASKGFGVRDAGSKAPVTADTVFRIASMTKSYTALAILKLRDAGRLSLDDPIRRFVPEAAAWRYPTRDSSEITVRQLLMHAEGFPEDNPWGDQQLDATDAEMTAWLRSGIPFSTPPGTAYEYSNFGFAILGRVVAAASGQSYREYMQREILGPLGLETTFWDAAAVPADRFAHGYRWEDEQWKPEPPLADGAFGPMGGLYTSGRDLARYVAYHLGAWPPRDDPEAGPVRRSSLREMHAGWQHAGLVVDRPAPDEPIVASTGAYGYGVRASRDCRLGFTVAHGGGLPGYGSHMIWLPEHGVAVIAMANLTYAPASGLTREILDLLHGTGALQPRRVAPSTAVLQARDTILRALERWDDEEMARAAADNLFLDRSADRRKAEVEQIRRDVGRCAAAQDLAPENWLRARFRATCERGWVDVAFTLAPTQPPRLQFLAFQPGRAMGEGLRAVADRLAAATVAGGTPARDPGLDGLFAASEDASRAASQLRALAATHGACRVQETVSGDGESRARVRYTCDRGRIDAVIARDPSSGTVRSLRFVRPAGETCVP